MIISAKNEKIKKISKLMTSKKERSLTNLFVAEGERLLSEVPDENINEIYISEGYKKSHPELEKKENIKIEEISEKLFSKISDTSTPQGILAIIKKPNYEKETLDEASKKNGICLLLNNVRDPGNLGTIMRMAEAAGVSAIYMDLGTVEIYNPKVVRSTMGAIFRMPFIYVSDLKIIISEMQHAGIDLYAAAPRVEGGGSYCYYEANYEKNPCGFIIGNEANGIEENLLKASKRSVYIPMHGKTESLNAAVAASVLCFEARRQKNLSN